MNHVLDLFMLVPSKGTPEKSNPRDLPVKAFNAEHWRYILVTLARRRDRSRNTPIVITKRVISSRFDCGVNDLMVIWQPTYAYRSSHDGHMSAVLMNYMLLVD